MGLGLKLVTLGQMLHHIETFAPHSDWESFEVNVEKKKTRFDYTIVFWGSRDSKNFEKIEALCGRFHTDISFEVNKGVCVR